MDNKAKIIGICAAVGVAATAAYFFYGRSNKTATPQNVDALLEKEAKEKHYDINLVHLIRNEFLRLAGTSGAVDKATFIEWVEKLFHLPTAAERNSEFIARLSLLFDLYDTDKNGQLNSVEFLNGLAMLSTGTIIDKATFMFDAWDTNKDGFLTYPELEKAYRQAITSTTKMTVGEGLKHLIGRRFSGRVATSATSLFQDLAPEKVDKLINEHVAQLFILIDENKDGKISKAEWLKHAEEIPFFRQLDFSEEAAHVTLAMSQSVKVEIVCSKYKAQLGEGPHWDPATKRLYYVDIEGKKFMRLDPVTEDLQFFDVGSRVGCLAPVKGDNEKFVVATQEGVILYDTKTQKAIKTIISRDSMEPGTPQNRFNDGKIDPAGRLWVGTMATTEQKDKLGSFYRIDRDGSHKKIFSDITISNGLTWSLDLTKMYYIDTPTQCVVQLNYNKETGELTDKKVVCDIPKELGAPDGMTIDTDGNLWVAMWGKGKVTKWNPNTGTLLQMIPFPAPNVTSVCFGGPNLDILYVTSASVDTDTNRYPEAGSVFAVYGLGAKGLPLYEY